MSKSDRKEYTSSELYALASSSPMVVSRLLSLPMMVGRCLGWRSTSVQLIVQLLGLLEAETAYGRRRYVEISHAVLGERCWPDLGVETAKNKLARWLKNWDEDQALSSFCAVKRVRGGMKRKGKSDEFEFEASRYADAQFFDFVEIVGARVAEKRVFELPSYREREAGQREIVATVLCEIGACQILPGMRDEFRQRRAAEKEKGKFEKRLRKAKEGEESLTALEMAMLPVHERLEIFCAQFLRKGERLLYEASYLDDPKEMKWLISKIKSKFEIESSLAMERRLSGLTEKERFEIEVEAQFQHKSRLRLVS